MFDKTSINLVSFIFCKLITLPQMQMSLKTLLRAIISFKWRYLIPNNWYQKISLNSWLYIQGEKYPIALPIECDGMTEYMECRFSDNSDREAEMITFDGKAVHGFTFFRYLGSIIQKDGELDGDVAHRIKAGWLKWKSATRVLCDPNMPHRLKGKFYRTAIRSALLYGTVCWAVKQCHVQKMNVAEMRMLRWMCGHTKKDRLRNEVIREKVRVASIEDKMMENRLRWFGHVRRRPVDAPVRRLESWGTINIVKGRGKPKKTWIKLIENDMRFLGIRESMAMERQIWKEIIRVVDEI
ncbi:hypothetical protein OROGR_032028 [Orobanche gracilis]